MKKTINILLNFFSLLFLFACTQFVEVDKLTDRLHEKEVFKNEPTANSAILGLYQDLRAGIIIEHMVAENAAISGEVMPYNTTSSSSYYTNQLLPTNSRLPWSNYYRIIYKANRAIEGLSGTSDLPEASRTKFKGEALFVRAFSHFMLVNFYGDIPLILTSDVEANRVVNRTPIKEVYNQIVIDLKDAQSLLQASSNSSLDRSRASYWSATALLSRTYLYMQDYVNAEIEADKVIRSERFELLNPGGRVFAQNSREAIWQWANNTTQGNNVAASFIYTSNPIYILTKYLLDSFEPGDFRLQYWVKTASFGQQTISIPYKFTSAAVGTDECYTAIRLAELYLIRAEAKMMQGRYDSGMADINFIRQHHGGLNTSLPIPIDQESALTVVLKERRVELFTEGAHRWFDLKRTGRLDATMAIEKPNTWNSWAALYPILYSDIQQNPNLTQNPGYE